MAGIVAAIGGAVIRAASVGDCTAGRAPGAVDSMVVLDSMVLVDSTAADIADQRCTAYKPAISVADRVADTGISANR
jgi:hypothetical protein